MLTKQMRQLKKETLADCRQNGVTVSEGLIRAKTYAGVQARWVERWIAGQRIPWAGYFVCTLGGALASALLQRIFG